MQDQHTPLADETVETLVPSPSGPPEFAALDPDCALAPGLFRSIPKGQRKQRLEVVYKSGGAGRVVRFLSPDLLGADDMRALQGVLAVASGVSLDDQLKLDTPQDHEGEQLVLAFDAKDQVRNQIALRVNGSFRAVARAVGLDPAAGDTLKRIRQSIARLCALTVFIEKDESGWDGSCHFMSAIWNKEDPGGGPGSLKVALNPRLADIALAGVGLLNEKYIRIDLREVRALRTDAGRLIHQRLCGWIDPGQIGRVTRDTLCGYVWPEGAPTKQAMAKRRQRVRRALRELQALERPWTVEEYGPGKFAIKRPKQPEPESLTVDS